MPQSLTTNRRIVLAERPNGLPDENTLKLTEAEMPQSGDGQDVIAYSVSVT